MNLCFSGRFWPSKSNLKFRSPKLRFWSLPKLSSSRSSTEKNSPRSSRKGNANLIITKSWSNLPPDILASIANTLGLIDLLNFRAVCKDWLSAASMTATAEIETAPNVKPYFLLHTTDGRCKLWDQKDDKTYSFNIPELKKATFLASKQGWLLLYRYGSLFFFCPFSRQRINLPALPYIDMLGPKYIGAFSDPPTSTNCIVSILQYHSNRVDMEMYVLSRIAGDTWTKYAYSGSEIIAPITSAIYCNGSFCFEDKNSRGYSFSVGKKKWRTYRLVHRIATGDSEVLEYRFTKNYSSQSNLRKVLKIDEDVSIWASGAISTNSQEHAICNELLLGSKDPNGALEGVWIQPRFHGTSSNKSWFI